MENVAMCFLHFIPRSCFVVIGVGDVHEIYARPLHCCDQRQGRQLCQVQTQKNTKAILHLARLAVCMQES